MDLKIDLSNVNELSSRDLEISNYDQTDLDEYVRQALKELGIFKSHFEFYEQELSPEGLFSNYYDKVLTDDLSGSVFLLIKEIIVHFNIFKISENLK